jgi:hypothetical protein
MRFCKALTLFFDGIGQCHLDGIADFFVRILFVVLKDEADASFGLIRKRPFPGNDNMERITAPFGGFPELFFHSRQKRVIKSFAGIGVFEFDAKHFSGRSAGSVCDQAAGQQVGFFDFYFRNGLGITDGQGSGHVHPILVGGDIRAELKAPHLIRRFCQTGSIHESNADH